MIGWLPITTAPQDGTEILAGKMTIGSDWRVPYPLRSKYLDGRWKARFRENDWCSYDPQPTHWMPCEGVPGGHREPGFEDAA